MKTEADMPRYKSHKTVQALEIKEVAGHVLYFKDESFDSIDAPEELFSRYTPVPGDFLVLYEDGYKSFSPRKNFIEGYTLT